LPDDISQSVLESQVALYENRAGRLESERNLRVAILPPLTAILIYFVIADSWWWLLAGLLLPAFYVQAFVRTREYFVTYRSLYELRRTLGLPPGSVREASARDDPSRP